MSSLEETLNAVLSDPAELEKLSRLAAQLMGGEAPVPDSSEAQPPPDGDMLRRLISSAGGGAGGDKTALLHALSAFLRPERQAKLNRALRMAHMARLARLALETYGGEGDV